MNFEFFDPQAELCVRTGHLPHWYQAGVTYFITFRTADSVPTSLMRSWHHERAEWLRGHNVDSERDDWKGAFQQLSEAIQREYHTRFSQAFLDYLDQGHGECLLKRPELAQIVADSLRHFDGQRYHLGDFVIMPNHVHLLVGLLGDAEVEAQCYSWKKFSAAQINRALGRQGRFWQEESFDHLVRRPEQFAALQQYIAHNPVKAGLREGEYLHWQRGDGQSR